MSDYSSVTTQSGAWAVDWEAVRRIVHSAYVAELVREYANRVEIHEDMGGYERFFRDPVYTLAVDWDRVKSLADHRTRYALEGYAGDHRPHDDELMFWLRNQLRDMSGEGLFDSALGGAGKGSEEALKMLLEHSIFRGWLSKQASRVACLVVGGIKPALGGALAEAGGRAIPRWSSRCSPVAARGPIKPAPSRRLRRPSDGSTRSCSSP